MRFSSRRAWRSRRAQTRAGKGGTRGVGGVGGVGVGFYRRVRRGLASLAARHFPGPRSVRLYAVDLVMLMYHSAGRDWLTSRRIVVDASPFRSFAMAPDLPLRSSPMNLDHPPRPSSSPSSRRRLRCCKVTEGCGKRNGQQVSDGDRRTCNARELGRGHREGRLEHTGGGGSRGAHLPRPRPALPEPWNDMLRPASPRSPSAPPRVGPVANLPSVSPQPRRVAPGGGTEAALLEKGANRAERRVGRAARGPVPTRRRTRFSRYPPSNRSRRACAGRLARSRLGGGELKVRMLR